MAYHGRLSDEHLFHASETPKCLSRPQPSCYDDGLQRMACQDRKTTMNENNE